MPIGFVAHDMTKTPDPFNPGIAGTCSNLRGSVGRNILRGPGLVNLDTSLFKNNLIPRISETFNAQFRFEVFNVLNRANFQLPVITNDNIFTASGGLDPNGGVLTSTGPTARQLQLALKIIW